MIEVSKKVGPWREATAKAAHLAMKGKAPLDGPLHLTAQFRLPMPQARRKVDGVVPAGRDHLCMWMREEREVSKGRVLFVDGVEVDS